MGRHGLRHPGVRSETEEQIRYRGLPLMGGRCARGYARSEMAQYRGLRESARRRSPAFSGAAPKSRAARGACAGHDRRGFNRYGFKTDELAGDSGGAAETSPANIQYAN